MTTVALLIVDALPHRHVGPDVTPSLWRLVESGGRAPDGVGGLPVSVTYANHAAFVTGLHPRQTGLWANHAWNGTAWVKGPPFGPGGPTLFDRAFAAGIRSVCVVGDQKLVQQMGATAADEVWPPAGILPEEAPRCALGYARNRAVVDAVAALDLSPAVGDELVVVQLNEPDTTSHIHGPDSERALATYRSTDAALGEIVDLLRPRWDDLVLCVLSDHDQEPVVDTIGIDLASALADLDGVSVVHEGTAALGHGAVAFDRIEAIDGIEGFEQIDEDVWMAWTEPGRVFGTGDTLARGQHGSPRCRPQVGVVAGGHPGVPVIAERLAAGGFGVLDWAPLVTGLLELD